MKKKSDVPVFILAGGLGTRFSEETVLKPKPMIEIGDLPILVHIMRYYYRFGFDDFVICAGYKSWEIKNYFLSYAYRFNALDLDLRDGQKVQTYETKKNYLNLNLEKWRVRVIDTGTDAMTGARVARAFDAIAVDGEGAKFENFALTYGDGLSEHDLDKQWDFHQKHGKIGTVLGVHPRARFGELDINGDQVQAFLEKPQSRQGYINGGFFFLKRDFRKYLSDKDDCILEQKPLSKLAEDRELNMYKHEGFWQPMDTLRDKTVLQEMYEKGEAPWVTKK